MKYHKKEKIYCLSEEDRLEHWKKGTRLLFDEDVNNYYWILETVEETEPDFFQVGQEDWTKLIELGYVGDNDIREITEWFEFEHKLSYTRQHYQGVMIIGSNNSILESYIIIGNTQLSNFLSIQVSNIDERSKWNLVKNVIHEFLYFFDINEKDEFVGPSTACFSRYMEGGGTWMKIQK